VQLIRPAGRRSWVRAVIHRNVDQSSAEATVDQHAEAKQTILATLTSEDAQEWRAAVEETEVFTGLPRPPQSSLNYYRPRFLLSTGFDISRKRNFCVTKETGEHNLI